MSTCTALLEDTSWDEAVRNEDSKSRARQRLRIRLSIMNITKSLGAEECHQRIRVIAMNIKKSTTAKTPAADKASVISTWSKIKKLGHKSDIGKFNFVVSWNSF